MHAVDDTLTSPEAGARIIRGSVARVSANVAGILMGLATATLLLHHLGVPESGRYITVMSLVSIASTIADAGLNTTGSRELAIRGREQRRMLVANFLGLRLAIAPFALVVIVAFAALAGYPSRMVVGTALAGAGLFIVAVIDAALLPLTVELRNGALALVDVLKQIVTLAGVALLVVLGAHLTPFFAIQIAVGLAVIAVTPLVVGRGAIPRPRFDRAEQRAMLATSLPLAAAIVLGQVYFRLVMVLMSLISNPRQTGYFGAALRAMDTLTFLPMMVAAVALPVLVAAARDDRTRLRYAIEGLTHGAVVAGVLVVIVTVRAAEPTMGLLGGPHFRPAGAVLRIQVGSLLFIAVYQIWTVSLIALGRERDLIFTNVSALLGVGLFAAVLIPLFGAIGGATATVMGDALLASLLYWRLRREAGRIVVRVGLLARVAVAAVIASGGLLIPGLPDFAAAALAGVLFLTVGYAIGMVPEEVRAALLPRRLLEWRGTR